MAHDSEAVSPCLLEDESIIHWLSGLMERDPLRFEAWMQALGMD